MQGRPLVPLLDLTGAFGSGHARDRVVDAVRVACEELGFLVVTGHGVPDRIVGDAERAARGFFALPLEEKLRCAPAPGIHRGYIPMESTTLARASGRETPPDLCEVFSVNRFDDPDAARRAGLREGREAFFAPNLWPAQPADLRQAFEAYYAAMEGLANHLLGLMALALGLDEDWFDGKVRNHVTSLTANHYPQLEHPPAPGQLRRGEHTDWGSLTILHHDGQPGLQVRSPDGAWVDVPYVDGAFIVNLGDLMAMWTNGRWTSTGHRVVVPAGNAGGRLAIAFFHQPAYDARIECIPTCTSPDDPPRHPPTTSGEWIESMLERTTD